MPRLYCLLLGVLSIGHFAHGQNRHTTFKDSSGAPTTYTAHWASTFEGKYKSVYDKATNTRTLLPRSAAELAQEKAAAAKRIVVTKKLGQPLPAFRATDYLGQVFDSEQLQGKVLVINFWFVGCPPCEAEMTSLNRLYANYQHDSRVVFLSFVRSSPAEVKQFLVDSPFSYPIITFDKALQARLKPTGYPTNLVIDQHGNYAYEGVGAGVGSTALLEAAIRQTVR